MALGTQGGFGGISPTQQQGSGLFGLNVPRLGDFLGMGGEDANSAARRQMFLNGFRTQVGTPPQFGENVQQAAAQGFAVQRQKQQDAIAEQERQKQQQQFQSAIEFLNQRDPTLAAMVEGGMPVSDAYNVYMRKQQGQEPQYTAEQRNWMFAKENPDFAAAMGYGQVPEEIATARNRELLADQQGLSGAARQEFILTGKLPSSGGSVPMSPTIQKELFETDDAILAGQSALTSLQRAMELSKTAYDGPFAEQRGYGGAMFGDRGGQATLELTNEVTTQALSQLKVIFGAAPTEGERKILMEIQGSADKPKAVRDAIYQRAYDMAERKLAANQQKAAALRSGTYFSPDYGASTNSVGPGGVPDGVDPSDWQYMTPEERALWQ